MASSRAFNIQLVGLSDVQGRLAHLSDAIGLQVLDELEAAAFEMEAKADARLVSNKTNDQGVLRASLQVIRNQAQSRVEFAATAFHAPFIEFGTKTLVHVPPEWAEYAAQFKGLKRGNVDQFRENILDWMKRKGIQPKYPGQTMEEAADAIVDHILRFGLSPHPFMYPAYVEVRDTLLNRITRIINEATR